MSDANRERRILIMGAGGRDFHTFLTVYRDDPDVRVIAMTATQIPFISDRVFPASLSGPRYPDGIPIHDESELQDLLAAGQIDEVVFAYSDVSHDYVEMKRKLVTEHKVAFRTFPVEETMVKSTKPVVAVTAVRTGCGKSATSRAVIRTLQEAGFRTAAIRHPMPYGDLQKQAVQRFATVEDMDEADCTIEEREEYEPHVKAGSIVFAGVDYEQIVRRAEEEVDVVVWDGGNNDTPFYRPNVWIVLVDPFGPGDELSYFPGSENLSRADIAILTKMDSAKPEGVEAVIGSIAAKNPGAKVLRAKMPVTLSPEDAEKVKGARVLVVEDGPTVTHGGMRTGAATIAAERYGAAEIVDPRPWLEGTLKGVFESYPDIGRLLPAMGYSDGQMTDLETTVNASDADLVVIGTPIDLGRLIRIDKPYVVASYDVEFDGPGLEETMLPMLRERTGI